MRGEELTPQGVVGDGGHPYKYNAALGHLRTLAAEVPGVVRFCDERPERFAFIYPKAFQAQRGAVMALAAARGLLGAYRESAIGDALESLLERERAHSSLTQRGPGDLSRVFVNLSRSAEPYNLDPEVLDVLVEGILCEVEVAATYTHLEGDSEPVVIQPWSMITTDAGLFCYGQCVDGEHAGLRRLYNVRRIVGARLSKTPFSYPFASDYSPNVLFHHSFGEFLPHEDQTEPSTVILRFDAVWQGYFRSHRVHHTQTKPIDCADGGVEVTFHVYVTYDLVRWVRGLGKEVRVVEPRLLQEWVKSGLGARHRPTPI